MKHATLALFVLAALASGRGAEAATISFSDTIDTTTTDWSGAAEIQQFDPSLGTLTQVTYTIEGIINGSIELESTGSEPATVTAFLEATLTLQRPDASTMVLTIPTALEVITLGAFDSVTDFGGVSGRTLNDLAHTASATNSSPPGPETDLTLFTGTGTISLPVTAVANSRVTGGGNLMTRIQTNAAARVTVTYEFVAVPEPSSLALVGLGGLGALAAARRRRRSA